MANEQRLLEEAEDKKCNIMQEILKMGLAALKEENMRRRGTERNPKEEDMYFRGNFRVGGEICTKWKFYILYCIFWYLQVCLLRHRDVIYIYIMVILCHLLFDFFDRKRCKYSHG